MVSQFFVPPLQQYDFSNFIHKTKAEVKLNCNRPLKRCRLKSQSASYIDNAPPGCKMNLWCALLVNFYSDTHMCKNCKCISVSGAPGVHLMSGAEFLKASSLVSPILKPDHLIG